VSEQPTNPTPNLPSDPSIKKIEIAEKFIKNEKLEKIEIKEKPEKFEHKEKPEKMEHKEKPEKMEHKEKPEKMEHKEKPEKFESIEKQLAKERENKEIVEAGPITPSDPILQRLAALEQSMAAVQHFITTGERPDLSRGALAAEPGNRP
jgi:hypothetical protein